MDEYFEVRDTCEATGCSVIYIYMNKAVRKMNEEIIGNGEKNILFLHKC